MRIDLSNSAASQIASEQGSTATGASKTSTAGQPAVEDRTTLTSGSSSVSSLVSKALASPAVRQDKIDSLKQAVGTGQYELDPNKIASSIIDEHA